ncbi:hypothetical protein GCM10009102_06990 [Sphingomonas insulae]|uniref:Uncharacterized protein n=1 Tax=Sphingomonas insulae TaxID=424800 RepID=A0ABN1HNV1_9SPHN
MRSPTGLEQVLVATTPAVALEFDSMPFQDELDIPHSARERNDFCQTVRTGLPQECRRSHDGGMDKVARPLAHHRTMLAFHQSTFVSPVQHSVGHTDPSEAWRVLGA